MNNANEICQLHLRLMKDKDHVTNIESTIKRHKKIVHLETLSALQVYAGYN